MKKSNSKSAVRKPVASVSSSKREERLLAVRDFSGKKRKISHEQLKEHAFQEQDPLVRYRMNQALVNSDASFIVEHLASELASHPSSLVRKGAAEGLHRYAENVLATKALAQALINDPVSEVRYACASALGFARSFTAVQALDRASRDQDPILRKQIAFVLKRHKSPEAKKILKRLQSDSDAKVREIALRKE